MSWETSNKEEANLDGLTPEQVKEVKRMKTRLENSDVEPMAAIHCVIEAVQETLRDIYDTAGVDDIVEGMDGKDGIKALAEAGAYEAIIASSAIVVLDDIHTALHRIMAGHGVSDLGIAELEEVVQEWVRSDKFKEKYSSIPYEETIKMIGAK